MNAVLANLINTRQHAEADTALAQAINDLVLASSLYEKAGLKAASGRMLREAKRLRVAYSRLKLPV